MDEKSYWILDQVLEFRIDLAEDVNTRPSRLAILAKDEAAEVRYYVAENINTPIASLIALTCDKNDPVRFCALENPVYIEYLNNK